MSVNAKLITALSGIAPTAPGVYTGDEPKYIVFSYTLTGAMYADNVPQCLQYLIQVHYFCPAGENSLADREGIMRSLNNAGFGWPTEEDATDVNGQHYVYDCTYLEGLSRG